MKTARIRRLIGFLILLVSLVILIWGIWPFEEVIHSVPISPSDMQLPDTEGFLRQICWLI